MRSFKFFTKGLLLSAMVLAAVPAFANVFADVNGDDLFDVADVTTTLKITVGAIQPTEAQIRAADVSPVNAEGIYGDKVVDVSDAIRMLKKIVGTDTFDPWPGVRSVHDNEPGPTGGVPLPNNFNETINADVTKVFKLDGGFKLQGKLNGGTGTQGLRFYDEVQKISVSETAKADRSYTVGVPAGNYKAYVNSFIQSGFSSTIIVLPTGETVAVNADTTRDFTVPALPQLFKVTGTIAAPEGIEPPFSFSIQQIKDGQGTTLPDNFGAIANSFTMDGTYSVDLPAGTYKARFTFTGDTGGFTSLDAQETFTVVADMTQNLTSPPLVNFSGAVTTTGTLPAGTSYVNAVGTPIPNLGFVEVENGAYSVSMPKGPYALSFSRMGDNSGNEEAPTENWNYQVGNLDLQADTVRDLLIPALPAGRVKLTGTVVGPTDQAVTNAFIMVSGSELVGADPKLTFSLSGVKVNATGSFVVNVPAGKYRIYISPNPGFPVTNKAEFE